MIATHAPKLLNARLKTPAVAADIVGPVQPSLICSQTTDLRRKFWAAPQNAAQLAQSREQRDALPDDSSLFSLVPSLPDIKDGGLKQILLPTDSAGSAYVSVTPAASMGLGYEVFRRLGDRRLPFLELVVQPTPAAIANHGEMLLQQRGIMRLLRRGPAVIAPRGWRGRFVQLTARCQNMNVSAGMVAVGFPAITAIGGFVHAVEREVGQSIEFAVGIRSSKWKFGVTKATSFKMPYGKTGMRTNTGSVTPVPGYSTEEITANCEIVLLLKSECDPQLLCYAAAVVDASRLAGGSLFDVSITAVENEPPPHASYLIDASRDVLRLRAERGIDSLHAALDMYKGDGEWIEGEWIQSRNGYTLNQTGYALLEPPQRRNAARAGYLHAWAEPVFSLITQGSMTDDCWWRRVSDDSGVFWRGESNVW